MQKDKTPKSLSEQLADIIQEHYVKPVTAELQRVAKEASPEMLAIVPALRYYL